MKPRNQETIDAIKQIGDQMRGLWAMKELMYVDAPLDLISGMCPIH